MNAERFEWELGWSARGEGEGEFVPSQRQAPLQLDGDSLSTDWVWEEVKNSWEEYPELAAGHLWSSVGRYYGRYAPFSRICGFYIS
jgi:hypothetical protein